MRIIANADDLGSSRKQNAAIFALMSARRIRSATLLPNGRAFDDAVAHIPMFPHCSFGIHLNAASGPPVGDPRLVAPILGSDGCVRMPVTHGLLVHKAAREAVWCEWRSQIAKVRQAGVDISHIDSHHHLHTVPALFGVLKRLQREFGIGSVRRSGSIRTNVRLTEAPIVLVRAAWDRLIRLDGTKTTDRFCSLMAFRNMPGRKWTRDGTIEVMVHPGFAAYQQETRLLESDWWKTQIEQNELITYREL